MKFVRTGLLIAATLGFAQLANAADMPRKALGPAPAPPPTWTGWYLGGHAGGGWSSGTATWNPLPSPAAFGQNPVTGDEDGSGIVAGIHGGYNWQLAPQWVVGIEADWTWTNVRGAVDGAWVLFPAGPPIGANAGVHMERQLNWLATVRGRIGTTMWNPNTLLYFTGGVAWGDFDYLGQSGNFAPSGALPACTPAPSYCATANFSDTKVGYVLGGGGEWMMNRNWMLRVEYLFYHFDGASSTVFAPSFPVTFPSNFVWSDIDLHTVRAGLSYKF